MNKNLIIGIIVALIIVAGGFTLIAKQSVKKTLNNAETIQEKANDLKSKEDLRYVEYSKAVFDQSADKRRVLYFYANWCPTCRSANEDFMKNSSKIPEDVVVIRVNYNDSDTDQEEKELARKYGITYQHTYVQIDQEGKEVVKWNGGETDELLTNIK